MGAHLADWANLLIRWTHLITGVAWIGSSFYFIWLDSHLTDPDSDASRPEVEGELWMVHSGGFYQVERRRVGPGRMPRMLHWFKWEAMLTWLSGLVLLVIVYYLSGGVYLLRPGDPRVTVTLAVGLTAILLGVTWLVYDALYRSPLGRRGWPATVISAALLFAMAGGLDAAFTGRAAYLHVGVALGTLMVLNVWLRILPAQQAMIDATAAGREPDLELGRQAKRRSVHNSYLTFPVLFIMLSTHYPQLSGHPLNVVLLMLLIAGGALARHAMIGKGPRARWAVVPVVGLAMGLVAMTAPKAGGRADGRTGGQYVRFAEVRAVINQRCLPCHSAYPTDRVFTAAPGGVMFDDPAVIRQLAARIRERSVVQQTMPLANQTGMSPEERALLGRWVEEGAELR